MKLLRILLALAVVAYAGWLAWPVLAPLVPGGSPAEAARFGVDSLVAVAGDTPRLILWGAAILLYVLSALMLGAGNRRAVIAYLMGFMADAVLRVVLSGGGGPADVAARSAAAAPQTGIDPQWLILGALALGAVLIAVASRRKRRQRTVLNLSEA